MITKRRYTFWSACEFWRGSTQAIRRPLPPKWKLTSSESSWAGWHPPKMGWSREMVSYCRYKKHQGSPPPVRTASNVSTRGRVSRAPICAVHRECHPQCIQPLVTWPKDAADFSCTLDCLWSGLRTGRGDRSVVPNDDFRLLPIKYFYWIDLWFRIDWQASMDDLSLKLILVHWYLKLKKKYKLLKVNFNYGLESTINFEIHDTIKS